jgi:hypothetical protein
MNFVDNLKPQLNMNLRKYIEKLTKFAEEDPQRLEMEVVYASDDEGNKYTPVYYNPSEGHFDNDGGFMSDKKDLEDGDYKINAVCIN